MIYRKTTAGLMLSGALASIANAQSPSVTAVYTGEVLSVVRGGVEQDTAYLGNLDVDFEYLFGEAKQMRAYLYFLGNHGDDPSASAGDIQGISNIAAPRALRIYEAWIEREVLGLSLKVGLYDLNSEFDAIDSASLFVHPSFGIGSDFSQAGLNGPSIFPNAGLGIRAYRNVGDDYLQFAVIDGVPGDPEDGRKTSFRLSRHDGALLVSEFGRSGELEEGGAFKLATGIWHFSARYENLDGDLERGNQGIYILGERHFVQAGAFQLAGFARVGFADDSINSIATYVGAGIVASGFFPGRPDDRMGVAFARAVFSNQWREMETSESAETAIEWSYELPLADWLTLQPTVQYVKNPSGDASLDDAVIAGLRFSIAYAP